MDKDFNLLKEKFDNIKALDWVKSMRKSSTVIGYTFEQLIGKD